jgi:hypothetical protein
MGDFPYGKEIEIFCRRVVKKLKPRAVVLSGSIARGEYWVGSDVDLVVISENLPTNFLERLRVLSELNPTMAPIEALGYTPEEFLQMIERRHPTALYAAADGKPLHDDGFLTEVEEAFERVKMEFDLVRTEHGWDARALTSKARV